MKFNLCVCSLLMMLALATVPLSSSQSSEMTSLELQQDMKLLLDIAGRYVRSQVYSVISPRNNPNRLLQQSVVMELNKLIKYASVVNEIVEEKGENVSMSMQFTKTLLDRSLNKSYNWLTTELGSDVSESLVRTTATNMLIQEQTQSLKKLFPGNTISITSKCSHISTNLLAGVPNKCHIIRTISKYCAHILPEC